MITKLPPTVLGKTGERLRAAYLVPQAVYTLGLAAGEGDTFKQFLPANCLEETTILCEDVDKARQDKTIAAAEAKQATGAQQSLVRDLKVWRRQAGSHVEMIQLAGANIPDGIVQFRRTQAVPVLLEDVSTTLGLLEQNRAALDAVGTGTQALIDEGKRIYQALLQAERTQEQARAKDLPEAVATFNKKKGELYIALKIINAAGHRVHSQDPMASARFNLSILNQHHRQSATAEPAPAPQPAPAPRA
jgi:hypothetical protein